MPYVSDPFTYAIMENMEKKKKERKDYNFRDEYGWGSKKAGSRLQSELEAQAYDWEDSVAGSMQRKGLEQAMQAMRGSQYGQRGMPPAMAQRIAAERAGQMALAGNEQAQAQQARAQMMLGDWLQQEAAGRRQYQQAMLQRYLTEMAQPSTAERIFGGVLGVGGQVLGAYLGNPGIGTSGR